MNANTTRPDLAFLFPGQGSQSLGMLDKAASQFPQIVATFNEASQVLGVDLWGLVQEGPEELLNQTVNTQPVMLAAGVALWRVWNDQGGAQPAWMAGHSLGEYTALVCAGSLGFKDAVTVVAERGRLMQSAVAPGAGAMAAVLGLEDSKVIALCRDISGSAGLVEAVNFNAPGQVVIAGQTEAVERACEAAKAAGAKRAVVLPVSVPSHCALMKSAAEKLHSLLDSIAFDIPKIPVVHNVDVGTHAAPEVIRSLLAEQLYSPVRWTDSIRFMRDQGINYFVECGPGKVLSGLNKRIARDRAAYPIEDPEVLNKALEDIG